MDKYYEQLTPVYKSKLYTLCRYLYVAVGVLSFLSLIIFLPAGLIFAAIAALLYFIKRNGYIEYEYAFTSGDIDIDMILETKKRKRIISFNVSDLIMLAPKGSSYLDGTPKGKEIFAYPKDTKEKVFVGVVNKDSKVYQIYFTPNKEFIDLCFRSNPKNVKKGEYII